MSLIPLLDDSTNSIRESLSLEEISIALSFLRKRFKEYSIKEIVLSLNEYILDKEHSATKHSSKRLFSQKKVHRSSLFEREQEATDPRVFAEQRAELKEELKLIAKLFCESGIRFSLAKYFFPHLQMCSQVRNFAKYENLLRTIAIQTLNNIEKYLQYECNIIIEQLTKPQKNSLKEKLVHVREWMAKKEPQNFETYLKFIERHYQNQSVEIDYKEAFSLYKFLLESVRGPEMQLEEFQVQEKRRNKNLQGQVDLDCQSAVDAGLMNFEEEKALLILLKKHGSISKTSDSMCQRFGYNLKWSKHSIRMFLRRIYKNSLKKLVQSSNSYLKNPTLMFGYGDNDVNAILESDNSSEIKNVLLDFYGLKKMTVLKLKECIQKANDFFTKENSPESIYEQIQTEAEVTLPLLIRGEPQTEPIEIKDENALMKSEIVELENVICDVETWKPAKQRQKRKIYIRKNKQAFVRNKRRSRDVQIVEVEKQSQSEKIINDNEQRIEIRQLPPKRVIQKQSEDSSESQPVYPSEQKNNSRKVQQKQGGELQISESNQALLTSVQSETLNDKQKKKPCIRQHSFESAPGEMGEDSANFESQTDSSGDESDFNEILESKDPLEFTFMEQKAQQPQRRKRTGKRVI